MSNRVPTAGDIWEINADYYSERWRGTQLQFFSTIEFKWISGVGLAEYGADHIGHLDPESLYLNFFFVRNVNEGTPEG